MIICLWEKRFRTMSNVSQSTADCACAFTPLVEYNVIMKIIHVLLCRQAGVVSSVSPEDIVLPVTERLLKQLE